MSIIDKGKLEEAIGRRADYYLREFERIEGGRSATWNWPAFFASTAWFDYRGMSGYATLNFFAPWIALVLAALSGHVLPLLRLVVLLAYVLLMFIVVPRFANALYLRHLKKRIARASASGKMPRSPGRLRLFAASMVGAFAFLLPTGFLIVAPAAYVDYRPRSQVSEAISLLSGAKTPFSEYRSDKGRWPDRADEVLGNTSGKYTERLEITRGAGAGSGPVVLTATMKPTGVYSGIAGKTVQLSSEDEGKTWTCRRGAVQGLEDKYLPASCR
jgi:type IV pilus assembly protein PilA